MSGYCGFCDEEVAVIVTGDGNSCATCGRRVELVDDRIAAAVLAEREACAAIVVELAAMSPECRDILERAILAIRRRGGESGE